MTWRAFLAFSGINTHSRMISECKSGVGEVEEHTNIRVVN